MNHATSSAVLVASAFTLGFPGLAPAAPGTEVASAAAPAVGLQQELNLNLFRNPSIGLEYRLSDFAVHAGMYPTIISEDAAGNNRTTWFVRAGLTWFFLGHSFYGQRPSEFYLSGSYLRGLHHGRGNGAMAEGGYRWMVWRGLNVRLGAAVLLEPGQVVRVNPTPGIGWSHSF